MGKQRCSNTCALITVKRLWWGWKTQSGDLGVHIHVIWLWIHPFCLYLLIKMEHCSLTFLFCSLGQQPLTHCLLDICVPASPYELGPQKMMHIYSVAYNLFCFWIIQWLVLNGKHNFKSFLLFYKFINVWYYSLVEVG